MAVEDAEGVAQAAVAVEDAVGVAQRAAAALVEAALDREVGVAEGSTVVAGKGTGEMETVAEGAKALVATAQA
eukprot:7285381-Prymnesium_polylepis.1